jgi:hypothetical protein
MRNTPPPTVPSPAMPTASGRDVMRAGPRLGQGLCPWTPLGGDPPDPHDLEGK